MAGDTRGPSSKYNPKMCDIAYQHGLDGGGRYSLASVLNIDYATLKTWFELHSELFIAYNRGYEQMLDNIEKAMKKKSEGFTYTETKKVYNAEGELVKTETIEKMAQPDTQAQMMILKNKRPDDWKDSKQVEHTGAGKFIEKLDADL